MSKKDITAFFFKLTGVGSPEVESALLTSKKGAIGTRNLKLSEGELIRIEHFATEEVSFGDTRFKCWYCDFSRGRMTHVPGKFRQEEKNTVLDLGEKEGVSEDTATLICPAKMFMIVQSNRFGPSVQMIEDYFTDKLRLHNLKLIPILDPNVTGRLSKKDALVSFETTFNVPRLQQGVLDNADMRDIKPALEAAAGAGATLLTIRMSAGKKKVGLGAKASSLISGVLKLSSGGSAGIKDSVVQVREDGGSRAISMDLLTHRVSFKETLEVNNAKMVPPGVRYDYLRRAMGKYMNLLFKDK